MIPINFSNRTRGGAWKLAQTLLFAALIAPPALAQESGGSGMLEQSGSTSDREKVEFSQAALTEMESAATVVSDLLESAEREKDTVKVNCLTKKLSGIRALSEVSAGAKEDMERALSSGDTARAEMEFRKVAVALSKVRQFLAEAEACVGDADSTPGVTDLNVNVDGLTDDGETSPLDEGESPGDYPDAPDVSQFQ